MGGKMEGKFPMLALPMGKQDYEKGDRMRFMMSCLPILGRLGWTIGVEFKGSSIVGWGEECLKELQPVGGRAVWHLPNGATKNLHKGLDDKLIRTVTEAYRINQDTDLNVEAITIHCAPAVSVDPPEDAGLERYNSPISAEEMLAHIKAQVEPLQQLKMWSGGILCIENVDITNFRGGGYNTPTYLQLQTGCWQDLFWLKEQTGASITFDTEHFFCARDFLSRDKSNLDPSAYYAKNKGVDFEALHALANIAGYWLVKGKPPLSLGTLSLNRMPNPRLFHLGGGIQAVDFRHRIDTHLPNFNYPDANVALNMALKQTMNDPEVVGCVVEVCGQLEPEKYSEWSPRPYDDEVAKMKTFLEVIDKIEEIQTNRNL